MIGVPDRILHKPGPLNEEEWEVMAIHDRIGADIVGASFDNKRLIEMIRLYRIPFMSERKEDPRGEELPVGARILAIADAYDSMVNRRSYRKGMSPEDAFAELRRCSGTQFDPRLVDRFVAVVEDFEHANSVAGGSKHAAIQLGLHMEQLAIAADSNNLEQIRDYLLYTSTSPRDATLSRMPSSA